ncbi:MAG: hypothetical protein ABSB31_07630 [Dehalococcoidia bacterium]|jgi:hypothetical protein
MGEKLQKVSSRGLWISTLAVLVLMSVQAWSGNWITFFLILPGGPSNLSDQFLLAMKDFATYHAILGFVIGFGSIIVLIFAFVHKSSIYVRIFAILGLIITASTAMGGILFQQSGFQDRWPLGQMADSFVGAYAAYFLQLFFMNRTPDFPWIKKMKQAS